MYFLSSDSEEEDQDAWCPVWTALCDSEVLYLAHALDSGFCLRQVTARVLCGSLQLDKGSNHVFCPHSTVTKMSDREKEFLRIVLSPREMSDMWRGLVCAMASRQICGGWAWFLRCPVQIGFLTLGCRAGSLSCPHLRAGSWLELQPTFRMKAGSP
jgi:hypothetical protein